MTTHTGNPSDSESRGAPGDTLCADFAAGPYATPTPKRFELIEAMGLEVKRYWVSQDDERIGESPWYVRAADLEAALSAAKSKRLWGRLPGPGTDRFKWYEAERDGCTHTALLINPQPIVRDTAEGLLRELVRLTDSIGSVTCNSPFIERAKRLLEGKA